MTVTITTPQDWHIAYIAEHLRPSDRREIEAASGRAPLEVIKESVTMSPHCFAGLLNNVPAGIGGVAAAAWTGSIGVPWLVGTPQMTKHAKLFVSTTAKFLSQMENLYDAFINYVDARNAPALRWLKSLGFVILPPEPYGVLGMQFHCFYKGNRDV